MNSAMIRYTLGKMIMVEGGLMLIPSIVSLIYREGPRHFLSFALVGIALMLLGFLLSFRKPSERRIYTKEGHIIVALTWFAMSFFGTFPLMISGDIPLFVDAWFEMVSGFTTTGSTILHDVEVLSHSVQFWRSFTHLIGGMGVLVFALAVMPDADSETVHLLKAEVPGPIFGKLVARLRNTARILYTIYLGMTAILIIALMLCGMNAFDAMIHAFSTAGTGGFSNYNASIGHFNSVSVEMVLAVAMLMFGVNFNLYYMILIGRARDAIKSEEWRWYLGIVLGATGIVSFILMYVTDSIGTAFRDGFFTVSSIITTTGFSTTDFSHWPLFTQHILLLLMFVGGCAGSTAGGLKVSRIAIAFKAGVHEIQRMREPKRALVIRFDGKRLSRDAVTRIRNYFIVYTMLFIFFFMVMTIEVEDFATAYSAVITMINNIGPGLGSYGPTSNFAEMSNWAKFMMSSIMIFGRLEIFPVLILLSPKTYNLN